MECLRNGLTPLFYIIPDLNMKWRVEFGTCWIRSDKAKMQRRYIAMNYKKCVIKNRIQS